MLNFYSFDHTFQQTPEHIRENAKVANITSGVSPWLSPLAYLLGRYFLLPSFFRQINIIGQENLLRSGPVILAPTHRARWDSLLLPYAAGRHVTGRDLRFMVTITECQGMQGWFVRQLGGFPINTERPAITSLRHAVDLLLQKQMLVIYPEGGIFRDRKLHPLKPGIARLALSAELGHPGLGVKVIPIGINYSHPYPSWGSDVSIHIGSAINVVDYVGGNVKQNAKRLTEDLAKMLQKVSHQELAISNHKFAEISQ